MKLIFMMTDTFRRDHIGAYGNKRIKTPNLDKLASISHVFDRHYTGSFPTGPNRLDMHYSRATEETSINAWTAPAEGLVPLAARLRHKGVHTMMIDETANTIIRCKMTQGFDAWYFVRGQEGDPFWSDDTVPLEFPCPKELIRYTPERWHQILVNRSRRRVEEDWFAPQTYKLGCEWIERNWKRDNFMLWIETFDPHEPWDPPQWYIDMYDPGYKGRVFDAPLGGRYRNMGITDREMRHTHARYCGECSMVDTAVGRVMATLEKVGIDKETAIVFTTDHGGFFGLEGDYGLARKPHYLPADWVLWMEGYDRKKMTHIFPLLPPLLRIPLFIHLPGQSAGKRYQQVTQPVDIAPTVMDLFGVKAPKEFLGQSLLPVVSGKKKSTRPYAFSGASHGVRQATNKDWLYAIFTEGQRRPWLMNLKNYPKRYDDVSRENPEVCRKMRKALAGFDPLVANCRL